MLAGSPQREDSLMWRDFQFVRRTNPWLQNDNAAGLAQFNRDNISVAQLYAKRDEGGFSDYYQSPESFQAGAQVEAFYRLSSRTVAFGSMSYDNFSGKDMAGSAFVDPTRRPFDIVEDSLTNTGRKHRDTYRIVGGIGTRIWHNVTAGLRLDYTAANYAKYKDLRHKNNLLDLTFTAGLSAPIGKYVVVGANYFYRRNTESIRFSTYGKNDKTYKSLIAYGAFIGQVEGFGSSGLTDKTWEQPFAEDYNGAAVQLEVKPTARLSLFNNFRMAHRSGYYGRKSPNTITFTRHQSNDYQYDGRVSLQTDNALHILAGSIDVENLENYFKTYRTLTNESGAAYYEYYDDVKSANKVWITWQVAYTADLAIRHELPLWTLSAGAEGMQRKQTAYVYPYYRRQNLRNINIYAAAKRHLQLSRGILSIALRADCLRGIHREPFTDLTFATPSDLQTSPAEMTDYLYREYDFLTAPRFSLRASAAYSFWLPQARMKCFAKISVANTKASELSEYTLGSHRTQLALALGVQF